jgi:hypothetical protein
MFRRFGSWIILCHQVKCGEGEDRNPICWVLRPGGPLFGHPVPRLAKPGGPTGRLCVFSYFRTDAELFMLWFIILYRMDIVRKSDCTYYAFIILCIFVYRRETLSFVVKRVYELRVFESRVMRLLAARREATSGWGYVHSDGLHNL